MHRSFTMAEYDFTHERRGTALLINNVDFVGGGKRQGSDADMRNLMKAFAVLGFDPKYDIWIERNITTTEMVKAFTDCVTKDDHANSDCFMCGILTHGDQGSTGLSTDKFGDLICGTNGAVALSELIKVVQECPDLEGKPKIFIVQACRGQRFSQPVRVEHVESRRPAPSTGTDAGATVAKQPADDATDIGKGGVLEPREDQDEDEESQPFTEEQHRELQRMATPVPAEIPACNDCLVVYATQPGFFAFRNKNTGSPFIKALCKQIQENGKTMDFMTLLTRVNRDVAYDFSSSTSQRENHGKKMMPWIASRVTKKIIFRERPRDEPME